MLRIIRRCPRKAQSSHARRGAALVEFAVVLPVFVTVVLGIIEVGRAIMAGQLISNAARESARMAIIDNSTETSVANAAKDFLHNTLNISNSDVTVTTTVTGSGTSLATAKPQDLVTVTVAVPFDKLSFLPPKWLAGKTLTFTAAMRHE
jgi:Flp pilus assembly protein TadG